MSCGCGGPCCADEGLGLLSSLTADQAVETVFPAAQVRGGAGHNASVRSLMVQAVQSGEMLDPSGAPGYSMPGDCAATGVNSTVRLAQTASGLALTGTTVGLTAAGVVTAAALAPWTAGISAIIGLFPIIFGHHAQAVKKEQSVLCAAVPAANNYLQIIEQAVSQGYATPQEAMSALDSLVNDFRSQVSSIIHGSDPTSSGECNAACVMLSQLRAIVAEKKSEYQDAITAAAAAPVARPNVVTSPGGGVPASSSYASFYSGGTGVPVPSKSFPWLPVAAAVFGALLIWEIA